MAQWETSGKREKERKKILLDIWSYNRLSSFWLVKHRGSDTSQSESHTATVCLLGDRESSTKSQKSHHFVYTDLYVFACIVVSTYIWPSFLLVFYFKKIFFFVILFKKNGRGGGCFTNFACHQYSPLFFVQ